LQKKNSFNYFFNMKKLLPIIAFCLFFYTSFSVSAQEVIYTDYLPRYEQWQENYMLDKIEYTDDRTIFYFRFVGLYKYGGSATFYGINGEFAWYLENVKNGLQKYKLKEVKNIAVNGTVKVKSLTYKDKVTFPYEQYDVFSCEVHFERLPNTITQVHLVEGYGKKNDENHFNCFNIKVKPFDDPDLGDPEDLARNIDEFNEVNNIPTNPDQDQYKRLITDLVEKNDTNPKPKPPTVKIIALEPPNPDF